MSNTSSSPGHTLGPYKLQLDMAEKDQIEGRCPACRTPYDKEKIVGMTVDCDSLAFETNMERKKTQKSRSKPSEGRKQLTSVRVIQRNLVYIVGLPLNLADEDLLYHKEYFGQYGKVVKVSMSRTSSGAIQQLFPNDTCSIYYLCKRGRGCPLHPGRSWVYLGWEITEACVNPDCLYLHEVGSQEDSFTKDEAISSHTRGTHNANQQSLATSVTSNGSSDIQRTTPVNGTLAFSAVVANAAHGPVSPSNILKRPLGKEENQKAVDKSKLRVLKPLQHNVVVGSGSKRTTSPDRDSPSNRLSSSTDSSYDGRDIDKPSAVVNSSDDSEDGVEDDPTVGNLSLGVSQMEITTDSRDDRPDIVTGSECDQDSNRQSDHEVSKLPELEQCKMNSSVNTDEKAIPSETGVPCTRPEWDWRLDLQSQMQVSSKLDVEDMSSLDRQRHHHEEDVTNSLFLSNSSSSILDSNHLASRSSLPCEPSGVNGSDLRFPSDQGSSDRLHLPNGFGEQSMFSVEHSLFANEGRNKVSSAEDEVISNILSLDFDPWDESLTSSHNLAELLGRVDQRSSPLKPSNLLKQQNSQSRFSFAQESSNQAYDRDNHSIYGQFSREQPLPESVVSRDIYRDNLGSLNGFASNYSGGLEYVTASPLFSSYKTPVTRPPVSAPPGFSAPSRLPPPGFSSHERMGLSSDTAPGTRFLDSAAMLRNAYQVPPPVGNSIGASDIEFADPAILAVGRGMINADLDMSSGFSSQMNSFGNETGLQMLRQQSLSAAQQQVNGFHHDLRNSSPSPIDPYRFNSRLMDQQAQGSSLSLFSQHPRQQQPSANQALFNGHWDKWNEGQNLNSLGMAELLRNERLGFNGSLYNNGYEEPKFRIPSPGDVYNRTYGM
ncbi:hypothetical protein Bca4012_001168 [Brassica carinata]